MIIPIFLTNLGCVHNCIYCSQKIASGLSATKTTKEVFNRINKTMEIYLNSHKDNIEETLKLPVEVAIYGSNFTAISFAEQKEIISFIKSEFERILNVPSNKENLILRISTSPQYIKKEQLLDLKIRFNLALVEIGVQSMDTDVLQANGRNYTADTVKTAARTIKNIGLILSCHQMTAMYGATFSSDIKTTRDIIKLKPHYVRVHPTLVLKGTVLEKLYLSGEYSPINLNEAVNQLVQISAMYKDSNIPIIRMGLHPSDLLEDNIVAGPWHESLRELVESEYLKKVTIDQFEASNITGKKVVFKISPKDETYFRGKENTVYNEIINHFNLEQSKIILDENLKRGQVNILEQ